MNSRPPGPTRTDTVFPYTALVRVRRPVPREHPRRRHGDEPHPGFEFQEYRLRHHRLSPQRAARAADDRLSGRRTGRTGGGRGDQEKIANPLSLPSETRDNASGTASREADAMPIGVIAQTGLAVAAILLAAPAGSTPAILAYRDRKSTRLNSSH